MKITVMQNHCMASTLWWTCVFSARVPSHH